MVKVVGCVLLVVVGAVSPSGAKPHSANEDCRGCKIGRVSEGATAGAPFPSELRLTTQYAESGSGACTPKEGGGCAGAACKIGAGASLTVTTSPSGPRYWYDSGGAATEVPPGGSVTFYPRPGPLACGEARLLLFYATPAIGPQTPRAFALGMDCSPCGP